MSDIIRNYIGTSQFGYHVTLSTSTWTGIPYNTVFDSQIGGDYGERQKDLVSFTHNNLFDTYNSSCCTCGPDDLDTRNFDWTFRVSRSEPRNVGAARC